MAFIKFGILALACFVFIEARVVPARCPNKCGKVVKVNKVIDCGCGRDSSYGIVAEVPKCGCGKVYMDASADICGCKISDVESQLIGLIDYLTAAVETKCGCQVTPCCCPSQSIRIPNSYDLLSAIELPSCGSQPVIKMAYDCVAPSFDVCGKCSKIDCNCRNMPYEVLTSAINYGCVGPVIDVPPYAYSLQAPVIEVRPVECGCGMPQCGCNVAKIQPCSCGYVNGGCANDCGCIGPCICGTSSCGCGISPCICGTSNCGCGMGPCVCGTSNCGCGTSPCVCGTSTCGCGQPNCGCVTVYGYTIPECECAGSCPCGISNCGCINANPCGCTGSCGCGVQNCGCAGICGCGIPDCVCSQSCGCRSRKYPRKGSIPPPFL